MENLPPSLQTRRETLARCIEAFDALTPVLAVYLFGSHARGEARSDSDIDLCIVAEGAERQLETARRYREAIWPLRPHVGFSLVPIDPARFAEKRASGDFFYATVVKEGRLLAAQN